MDSYDNIISYVGPTGSSITGIEQIWRGVAIGEADAGRSFKEE